MTVLGLLGGGPPPGPAATVPVAVAATTAGSANEMPCVKVRWFARDKPCAFDLS